MDWSSVGQSLIAWIFIGIWIWAVCGLIAETIIKKRDAAKLAEKDAIIWQLEQDRLYHRDTRRELIWVQESLAWEKSRRQQAEERADDFYKKLVKAYGHIRTSPEPETGSGSPAQVAA